MNGTLDVGLMFTGRTSLMIAHRLSTIRDADMVIGGRRVLYSLYIMQWRGQDAA